MKIPLIWQILFHVIMTILTGGLWMLGLVIWLILETIRSKK